MNKQKKIALGATALLLVLTVLYLAVLRPLLEGYEKPKAPPAQLFEGESYYKVGDTVYDQMVVMYDQLAFSDLFSRYVEYFPNYANIYGSVYAVALAMLWLYFCVCIIFYGAALNRWLMER